MAVGSTPIGRYRRARLRSRVTGNSLWSSGVSALCAARPRIEVPRVIAGLRARMRRSRERETRGVRGLSMRGEARGGDGCGGWWGPGEARRSFAVRGLRGGETMSDARAYEPERSSAWGARASRLS